MNLGQEFYTSHLLSFSGFEAEIHNLHALAIQQMHRIKYIRSCIGITTVRF